MPNRLAHCMFTAGGRACPGPELQWPTLLTPLMSPALMVMYARLAHNEEQKSARRFGQAWAAYAQQVPRLIPHWGARTQA